MDIILIPGLWLDETAWTDVTPPLEAAGHRVHALTMPGVGEPASDIELSDWVASVVEQVDAIEGPVMLVGHSGGGDVAWMAADARPERIAHVVFVDTVPPPAEERENEFPMVDGVVPFPGWDFFPDADVWDLDAQTRERAAAMTRPIPESVPGGPITLVDSRRHTVPVTVLTGNDEPEALEAALTEWGAYDEEFHAIGEVSIVKMGTGHWPQFTAPDRLAQLILDAAPR